MKQTRFAIAEILGTKPISTLLSVVASQRRPGRSQGQHHLELVGRLGSVAASEGRSVAQVCEAFLQAGLLAYEKEGSKYASRYLASHEVGKEK
jgi:hypothetical protein